MTDGTTKQRSGSPVKKQEAEDDGHSILLSCRLFVFIAGAVFMALVVLFGVSNGDQQQRGLSTAARPDLPSAFNAHQPVPGPIFREASHWEAHATPRTNKTS
ncbi:hypothetical protein MRX96_025695 [Rhipicephalus microplus]